MALRPSSIYRLHSSPFSLPIIRGQRPFSVTACTLKVSGPLPTFEPTSNPELDNHLNKIRDELFIPAHLKRRHRNLVYRPKNHYILNEEPLKVEVSGHSVLLTPKDHQAPVPAADFTKALNLMKVPSDLDAVPRLVEGFAQTKRTLKEKQLEKMARSITLNGRVDLLMAMARNAGRNGFKFTRPVAREFMRGLQTQNALPAKQAAAKSLKYAEQLLKFYCKPAARQDPLESLERDPVIVGTALYLATDTQVRFNEGKDYEQVVYSWVERLQSTWKQVEWEQALVDGEKESFHRAKLAVLDYSPVLAGMLQAKDILAGSKLSAWVASESAKLSEAVGIWSAFRERHRASFSASPGPDLGLHTYKMVAESLAQNL